MNDQKGLIALETGPVAYELLVARDEDFPLNENKKAYVYEVYNENDHYLVGFPSVMEKEAFLSLIAVKGIGPKTALGALGATNPDDLFRAISASNVAFLKKLPGIGPKAAAQIILDLKGKLAEKELPADKALPKRYEEVAEALKQLGFKKKEIDEVFSSSEVPDLEAQELLRWSLRRLQAKGKK